MNLDRVVDGLMAITGVKSVDVRGTEIRVKLLDKVDVDWDKTLRNSGANFIVRGEGAVPTSYTFLLGDSAVTLNVSYMTR